MARGDQIYVMRPLAGMQGVYEHHGIDCGDGTVIHYSKAQETPQVARTSFADFSWGNPIYQKRHVVSYIPDVVVERAESRLGERQYNLFTNNCEHFANWCKVGKNESEQLATYGIDAAMLDPYLGRRLIEEAAQEGDPVQAMQLFNQATQNVAIAQSQLQKQYDQAQAEMDKWHQVAQLALKQGREDLARAALERKVEQKRKATDYKTQIDQLLAIASNLRQNSNTLQQRAAIITHP